MSPSPPVNDRTGGSDAPSEPEVMPGTDDLESLLGDLPAVQRSRERKAMAQTQNVAAPSEAPPAEQASPAAVAPPPITPSAPPPTPSTTAPAPAQPQVAKPKRTLGESIWSWGFPTALILLALLIPIFGLMGYNAILDSNDGRVAEPITDPAASGFEVLLDPTPVTLMVLVDETGLVGLNLTSLAREDNGGTMIWTPPNLVSNGDDLAGTYASGGADAVADAVATLLAVDVGAVEEIDADRWADLTRPVAPIVVDLPDALISVNIDGSTRVAYPPGTTALEPEQVGEYLGWLNPGESQINRLARQEDFFRAWLAQIEAADDPSAVPGEDTGLGRFIRGLAAGTSLIQTLPMTTVPGTDADLVAVTDPDAVIVMVSAAVPLPVSPFPGVRPVVKLLDAVGDQPRTLAAIDDLVLGGAQVSVLGNAEVFGAGVTEIKYHVPEAEEAAQRLADSLGVGVVSFAPTTSEGETVVIEVTVIIGTDYEPAEVAE